MSRIGNAVIDIPGGVNVNVGETSISVKGPKGELSAPLFKGIQVDVNESKISVKRESDVKALKAKHGLVRALLANCIKGTFEGFSKALVLQGVGYRANKRGNQIVFSLGYSHDIHFDEPTDIKIEVSEQTKVLISGIDKQRVGQVAAQIRSFRPPEPYKGKGVHYEGERIRRKAGKAGKK